MGDQIDMNVMRCFDISVQRDFCGFSKKCSFVTFPKIKPKLCQFECQKKPTVQGPLKIDEQFQRFPFRCKLQIELRDFQNGLGHLPDVCSFQGIGQSRAHARSLTHSLTHSLIVLLNIMLLASHKMVVTENEDALLSTNLPECARAFAATIQCITCCYSCCYYKVQFL